MKNNIKCAISFIVGAGLGAFGGYKLFEHKLIKLLENEKEKQEQAAQEAYDEMIEEAKPIVVEDEYIESTDSFDSASAIEELNKKTNTVTKKEKRNYSKTIAKEKYAPVKEPEVEKGNTSGDIDIIPAVDFDAIPGFDAAYWTLYSDGVMVDDDGNIIESSMDYIGETAYNELMRDGETICVRNFVTKTDYKVDLSKDYYYDDVNTQSDDTID